MGNSHRKPRSYISASSPLKQTTLNTASDLDPSLVEERPSSDPNSCCMFLRKRSANRRATWEDRFADNCKCIEEECEWVARLAEIVRKNELNKVKYCREVNQLKRQIQLREEEESQLSAMAESEKEHFKSNLRKSFVVSFGGPPRRPIQKIRSSCNAQFRHSRRRPSNLPPFMSHIIEERPSEQELSVIARSHSGDGTVPKRAAAELEMFNRFSGIVERHLRDVSCALGCITESFVHWFVRKCSSGTGEAVEEVVGQPKQFLVLLKETVIDYYQLYSFGGEQPLNSFISDEDNVMSMCTAILFRKHSFYKALSAVVDRHFRAREERFKEIVGGLKGRGPECYTVLDKFCLNQRTIEAHLKKLSQGSHPPQGLVENLCIAEQACQQPYSECMRQLGEVGKARSPINKMKAIVASAEGITAEIARFYDRNNLGREEWLLDPDQVISILSYVIVNAGVDGLIGQLFLLDQFATDHQQITVTGYYLSVVSAAVEQLEEEHGEGAQK